MNGIRATIKILRISVLGSSNQGIKMQKNEVTHVLCNQANHAAKLSLISRLSPLLYRLETLDMNTRQMSWPGHFKLKKKRNEGKKA